MAAWYNEIDPYAAQWLRNLIAAGHIAYGVVDERDIRDVRADDLAGYTQCHFFAGIGGWSYALRIAQWPDERPVWTGSCPCQPFSSAARGRNRRLADNRDFWPNWFELIAAKKPRVVFGEQVAQAADWHARVGDDLEREGYAFGSAYLPACSVGLDHVRTRFYFVGHANRESEPIRTLDAIEMAGLSQRRGDAGKMVRPDGIPNRMAVLRAFGNSIIPQVAAEFIWAATEIGP